MASRPDVKGSSKLTIEEDVGLVNTFVVLSKGQLLFKRVYSFKRLHLLKQIHEFYIVLAAFKHVLLNCNSIRIILMSKVL